jgi:hypothetical protein
MRSAITRFFLATLFLALAIEGASAQAVGGGEPGGGKKHQQKSEKTAEQKPKADDKAYNAALKTLPNKPYDPWHNAR